MITNLNEHRASKAGDITPRMVAQGLMEQVEAENIERVVIIYETKDGEICSSASSQLFSSMIGMLEWVKVDKITNKE